MNVKSSFLSSIINHPITAEYPYWLMSDVDVNVSEDALIWVYFPWYCPNPPGNFESDARLTFEYKRTGAYYVVLG